jgi:hypothetical protein
LRPSAAHRSAIVAPDNPAPTITIIICYMKHKIYIK